MGKVWVGVLAAAGGFALGLYVAKMKYESQVRSGIGDVLGKVGLGGGFVESTIDKLAGVG